jgi:hypothetical protein
VTGICAHSGCFRSGTWRDEDDGKAYCGEHVLLVAPDAPHDALEADMRARLADREEERRSRREAIADELRGERFDEIARRSW